MTEPDTSGGSDPLAERRNERLAILADVQGEIAILQPMIIREIALEGVQIETDFPLQLNSLHDLRLRLGTARVVLKGRVVHCSIVDVDQEVVQYRSGLHFVEVPERISAVIAAFMETLAPVGKIAEGS